MKLFVTTVVSLSLMAPLAAHADQAAAVLNAKTLDDVRKVAPALGKHAQGPLADLWQRPGLAPRDRSIVTLAALIARNQAIEMPDQLELALDNGVEPGEISEIITHLAFYSGWPNAMAAAAAAREVFARRNIGGDQLAAASPPLLPLDEAAEADRASASASSSARSSRNRPLHDRRPVPRPLASARSRAARPQPGHGQRAGRGRPGRADPLPPQPGDG